jgi:hypothetical protein
MVLIGLLVVALACLVVGLVTAGAPWLVGSLVASVAAGYLLWKEREKLGARSGGDTKPESAAPPAGKAEKKAVPAAAEPAGQPAPKPTREQQVWVVDTMPQFHAENCAAIQNLDAEAIPLAQAVEDGFTECSVCTPTGAGRTTDLVWVVDGRPDYHLDDCRSLKIAASQQSRDPEKIPHGQAVEDGFSACPDCSPAAAPSAPATDATTPDSVWVVDGRPRYHLADCLIIKDQQAEQIPFAQAEEDGFMACSMCQPKAARV